MNTKKTVKKRLVLKKSVKSFITRALITVIIFLVGMILIKKDNNITVSYTHLTLPTTSRV